jgi:signal transduction histidine kinase
VSEELHDNIGQLLSFIRRSLSIADEQFGTPKGREQLNNAKAMVTKTLEEVRHISHSLNAELVKTQGIIYLLQQDLESLADSTGIICSLEKNGEYSSWTPEDQLLLYRMLQESMQNVVKHANATVLKLCFNFGPKEIEVTVADNGQGFDTSTETTNGLGFRNLHHRAAILGATLEMSSERNKGTILYIKIPIKK